MEIVSSEPQSVDDNSPPSSIPNPSLPPDAAPDSHSNRSSYYEGGPAKKIGNLFFQFGGQDDDVEQLVELQKGKEFEATYIVSESTGKFREVIMNINLMGIKVAEPKNKKRRREFDIEQILQYSYNRASQRFTFAYLESDGVLTNYRFISKDFFEIHQTLGIAIAMMVKVKNKEIELPVGMSEVKEENGAANVSDESAKRLSAVSISNSGERPSSTVYEEDDQPKAISQSIIDFPSESQEHHPVTETGSRSESAIFPDTTVVIHSGGDDDTMSILTNDDHASIADDNFPETIDEDEKSSGSTGATAVRSKSRKDKASFSKTIRGWNLFGTTKGPTTLKSSRKSTNELFSIHEGSHQMAAVSSEGLGKAGPELASMNSKVFGSMSVLDRRKSAQEIFSLGGDSDADSDRKNVKSSLSQHPTIMTEGAASAASVDTANLRESRELPTVDITYDEWGREVLIKNLKGGKYDITAGTVDMLVQSLAEEAPPDTIYIDVFLLTFRHFMTPLQFIKILQKRFGFQSEEPQSASIIKLRVVSVLKKWAERFYYDFRFPEMQEALTRFIEDINKTECAKYAGQIKAILDAEMERSKTFTEIKIPETPPDISKTILSVDFVTSWSPKRIAQELTHQDLKLFRTIKPDEFCLFLWGEKNDPRIANFNAYIDRFNRIGFWVSTVIVSQKDIKRRADAIEKFILILKYLLKYSNYSSLMALLSGLNTTAVSRLKKTWEIVNKSRNISIYRDIEAKMSYRGNFKAYRELESQAKQPFVPFFGLYVKDLTFMNDGNQKHLVLQTLDSGTNPLLAAAKQSIKKEEIQEENSVPPRPQLINFEKCRGITDKIHAIRIFQQSTYKFEEEKDEQKDAGFFSSFTTQTGSADTDLPIYFGHPFGPPAIDDEKKLIEMSRECEPSDRTAAPIPISTASSNYVIASTSGNSTESHRPKDPTGASTKDASPSEAIPKAAPLLTTANN